MSRAPLAAGLLLLAGVARAAAQPAPAGPPGDGALVSRSVLTLAGARKVEAAAEAHAAAHGYKQSVVVLDGGGNLVVFHRMDDAQLAGFRVALAKARTALEFRGPSKGFADRVLAGQVNVLGLPGAAPIDGGVPLMHGTELVGAVGVTGASPAQDGETAVAAAAAIQ